jgi:hypothetical protein
MPMVQHGLTQQCGPLDGMHDMGPTLLVANVVDNLHAHKFNVRQFL